MRKTRALALLTAVALISPAVAHAGPDDGKGVATAIHLDAPKVHWDNSAFFLEGLKDVALDDTVVWVSPTEKESDFQYTLPDSGALNDIGQPGEIYYVAPQYNGTRRGQIWWGYGADSDFPIEQFRNEEFTLDLLGIEGPGEMEMFYGGNKVTRQLGTGPVSPKSVQLTNGSHVHSSTLFTKPGRYELTYQSSARAVDGDLLQSEPQKLAVQVGGTKPKDDPTPSLKERFEQSDTGDVEAAGYSLQLTPNTTEAPGTKNTTIVSFEADNEANGILTLLIDGYFLADLPVENGKATHNEFFGPLGSDIQAVFTPETGEGPRWVSQPLRYEPGQTVSTTSAQSAEQWVDNTGKVRSLRNPTPVTSEEIVFTAKLEPHGEGHAKLTVETDPNFEGFITGGLYTDPSNKNATKRFEGYIQGGRAEIIDTTPSYHEGDWFITHISPHPIHDVEKHSITLTESFDRTQTYTGTTRAESPEAPAGEQPAEEQKDKSSDSELQTQDGILILDKGHVDITAKREGDKFVTTLRDDTGIHTLGSVDRSLNEVVLAVGDNARQLRDDKLADTRFDMMGPVGSYYYALPEVQDRDIIWPGYNTQTLRYEDYKDETVTLNIVPSSMPEGASWGLLTSGSLGQYPNVIANSLTDTTTIETTFPTHVHMMWIFSEPGDYEFDVHYSATLTDGTPIESDVQKLRVAVGDEAVAKLTASGEEADPELTPGESEGEAPKDGESEGEAPKDGESEGEAPKDGESEGEAPEGDENTKSEVTKPSTSRPSGSRPGVSRPSSPRPSAPSPSVPTPGNTTPGDTTPGDITPEAPGADEQEAEVLIPGDDAPEEPETPQRNEVERVIATIVVALVAGLGIFGLLVQVFQIFAGGVLSSSAR